MEWRAPGKGKKGSLVDGTAVRRRGLRHVKRPYGLQLVVVLIIVSNECAGAMISAALANNKERLCPRRKRNLLKYGWT